MNCLLLFQRIGVPTVTWGVRSSALFSIRNASVTVGDPTSRIGVVSPEKTKIINAKCSIINWQLALKNKTDDEFDFVSH